MYWLHYNVNHVGNWISHSLLLDHIHSHAWHNTQFLSINQPPAMWEFLGTKFWINFIIYCLIASVWHFLIFSTFFLYFLVFLCSFDLIFFFPYSNLFPSLIVLLSLPSTFVFLLFSYPSLFNYPSSFLVKFTCDS